jgi:hypothetical protein
MSVEAQTPTETNFRNGSIGQWIEIGLIVLLFFVYAGGEPPAANESHYLSKAKHYWNPEWCPGDFFLDSADAHLVFYWTFGWLTRFFSLTTTAWISRFAIWLWLAWSWHRLCRQWTLVWGSALWAAAIAVAGWHWGHLAGEWVVGGVEAKGLAYGFLFLAMADVARRNWTRPWIWLGLAATFHVLVSGWAAVALALTWSTESRQGRCAVSKMWPWMVGGGLLALLGLLPAVALTLGSDPEGTREAATVYVYQRLAHHLVFHRFVWPRVIAHGVAIGVWIVFWRASEGDERASRINRFVTFAVAIAIGGVVADRLSWHDRGLSSMILRFYWFRLADALVPCGLALSALSFTFQTENRQMEKRKSESKHTFCLVALLLCSAIPLTQVFLARRSDPRPEALLQGLRQGSSLTSNQSSWDWRDVCQWFRNSTRSNALVLTPPWLQTFRWYAHRGELCSWKDIPQDVKGILEWRDRRELVQATRLYAGDVRKVDLDAVERLVDHVRFSHLVVPSHIDLQGHRFDLQYKNASFAVYRLANSL